MVIELSVVSLLHFISFLDWFFQPCLFQQIPFLSRLLYSLAHKSQMSVYLRFSTFIASSFDTKCSFEFSSVMCLCISCFLVSDSCKLQWLSVSACSTIGYHSSSWASCLFLSILIISQRDVYFLVTWHLLRLIGLLINKWTWRRVVCGVASLTDWSFLEISEGRL